MTTSLLRGLRALEMLGSEALGVSEVARRLDVDKAGVSRMLGQLHDEGWVLRTGARYVLGERALSLLPAAASEVRRRAGRLVHDLHARTGHTAVVLRLSGTGAQPLASCGEDLPLDPEEPFEHLWSTAGGIALLAQLSDREVDRLLDVRPWPSYSATSPGDAEAVRALVRLVRAGGTAEERAWTVPGWGCTALPWPVPRSGVPHAALVLGAAGELERDADSVRRALTDAVDRH